MNKKKTKLIWWGHLFWLSSLFLCVLTNPVAVHFCMFVPFLHWCQPFFNDNHVQIDTASTFFLWKGYTFLCILHIKIIYGTRDGLVLWTGVANPDSKPLTSFTSYRPRCFRDVPNSAWQCFGNSAEKTLLDKTAWDMEYNFCKKWWHVKTCYCFNSVWNQMFLICCTNICFEKDWILAIFNFIILSLCFRFHAVFNQRIHWECILLLAYLWKK